MPHRARKLRIFVISLAISASVVYLATVVSRSNHVYPEMKSGRGWTGRIHRGDPDLGLATHPGGRGAETFTIGPDVPARIDDDGFRVPENAGDAHERALPLVLALGCSFTYGSSCIAEETFPFLVGERLHGTGLNAGVCSYGLAQMLILARRLIPKHRPEFVLVQYSPWLVQRSRSGFAPVYIGLLPTPHFVDGQDGRVVLAPPEFESIAIDLPLGEYIHSPRSALDLVSFTLRVGLPLYVHDDVHRLVHHLRRKLRMVTKPAGEETIVQYVYTEIATLCAASGSKMIVVVLDDADPAVSFQAPNSLKELGCPLAYGTNALRDHLAEKTPAAFAREYEHWRGDPPELVDEHPNAKAHAIIAEEIVKVIEALR